MKSQAEHANIYICLFKPISNVKKPQTTKFKSMLGVRMAAAGDVCKTLIHSFLILQISIADLHLQYYL